MSETRQTWNLLAYATWKVLGVGLLGVLLLAMTVIETAPLTPVFARGALDSDYAEMWHDVEQHALGVEGSPDEETLAVRYGDYPHRLLNAGFWLVAAPSEPAARLVMIKLRGSVDGQAAGPLLGLVALLLLYALLLQGTVRLWGWSLMHEELHADLASDYFYGSWTRADVVAQGIGAAVVVALAFLGARGVVDPSWEARGIGVLELTAFQVALAYVSGLLFLVLKTGIDVSLLGRGKHPDDTLTDDLCAAVGGCVLMWLCCNSAIGIAAAVSSGLVPSLIHVGWRRRSAAAERVALPVGVDGAVADRIRGFAAAVLSIGVLATLIGALLFTIPEASKRHDALLSTARQSRIVRGAYAANTPAQAEPVVLRRLESAAAAGQVRAIDALALFAGWRGDEEAFARWLPKASPIGGQRARVAERGGSAERAKAVVALAFALRAQPELRPGADFETLLTADDAWLGALVEELQGLREGKLAEMTPYTHSKDKSAWRGARHQVGGIEELWLRSHGNE